MLELRRVRLVNWHFFDDSTIPIGSMTLLAGDNGTGKSTIIDAIQYALVAQVVRIRFNSAAIDRRTARSLESYCRCKIGTDSVAYVRNDCITHVILEFADGERVFCAGIMVEAFAEGDSRESPWVLDGGAIGDVPVFDNDRFITPRVFRDGVKRLGGHVCATKREYNNRLTNLLGVYRRGVDFNPYLEALVRSVSFTPFTSVNDFVCNYILEEHPVDVGAMKENLENYRIAEEEAKGVELRISKLEAIAELSDQVVQTNRQILRQEYLRIRLAHEDAVETLERTRKATETAERELSNLEEHYRSGEERKARLDAHRQEMVFALAENEEHRLYERLRRDLEESRRELEHQQKREESRATLLSQCEAMLGRRLDTDLSVEEERIDGSLQHATRRTIEIETEDRALNEELGELTSERDELANGILRYPRGTEELKSALEEAGIEAQVVSDLLEITDESWQNAIEGWLNTQRFNILVPESDFQRALEVYDQLPVRVAGVGIPNLSRFEDSEAVPGSLAEIVTAATPQARRYAAFLLGDVIRAEIGDLKSFGRAITRECMAYSGHTARRIKQEVYTRWYIGRSARKRRLEALDQRIDEVRSQIDTLRNERVLFEGQIERERRVMRSLPRLLELADASTRIERLASAIGEIEARVTSIDTGSFEAIKLQIGSLTDSIADVEKEMNDLNRRMGELGERVRQLATRAETESHEAEQTRAVYDGFVSEHIGEVDDLTAYYAERVGRERSAGRFSWEDFKRRYDSAYQGLVTRRHRNRTALRQAKQAYNHDFATILELEADDAEEYRDLLRRYHDTELPTYRDRISRARTEAERQFRDHFVARLNEYLIDAEESFREINHILRTITFGRDQYRFSISRKTERRALLSAIATAAEVRETEGTLFEILHEEAERQSIEALFEQILAHNTDDPVIRDLCDYRQYFTYDIRIRHLDHQDERTGAPLESNLSQVLREKSGGETQTPYYVAIAASFFRFYKETPDAIRLVLFDEAFNKMDDERIGQTIAFLRKLSMQVITAVPTEKLESIAPFMDRTSLVLRRDHRAFVRDYEIRA